MKFNKAKKKPVEIEFLTYEQLVEAMKNEDTLDYLNNLSDTRIIKDNGDVIQIETLEGTHNMTEKDVLIFGKTYDYV